MVDDTVDTSLFFSMAEEEENGHMKSKNVQNVILENLDCNDFIDLKEEKNDLTFYVENYSKPYLNLVSPPPRFV